MKLSGRKIHFLGALFTVCSLFAVTTTQAQTIDLVDTWDVNKDDIVDTNEFNDGFASGDYYNTWDVNSDGWLNEDEFGDGLYGTWDANDDDIIDTDEWNSGLYNQFGDDYADFSAWDTDGNNEINDSEYNEVYSNSSVYNDWDADGNNEINDSEVNEGVFSWFDGDDDGYLSEDEAGNADGLF